MAADSPDSPIEAILAQCEAVGLSDEQRQKLELADIDFRRRAIELLNQRQLLALEMRRARLQPGASSAPDAEGLAAADALTVKLRQLWLHARQEARSLLSAEQLAKMPDAAGRLPGFDLDDGRPASADLAALVSAAVASRLKDSKVVEVETAQAIAERLIGWAKTAAIVTAIPLALLAIVLTVLGISNWTDFSKKIDEGKKDVAATITDARQTVDKVKDEAKSFQKEYADLKVQLGDISGLKKDVSDLADKVKRLERVQFDQGSSIAPEVKSAVETLITQFRTYLQSLGYRPPETDFTVSVDPNVQMNAYYNGKKMVIDPKLVSVPDVLFHEYAQRMLNELNPKAWASKQWKVQAILQGLSDYFSCSYQGDPKFGTKFVEVFADKLPDQMRKNGLLRNLVNRRPFPKDTNSADFRDPHDAGEVWGGIFWDIRSIFGCRSDAAKCPEADSIILATWKATEIDPYRTMDVRFARGIIEKVRQSVGADQADKVRAAFTGRGLTP